MSTAALAAARWIELAGILGFVGVVIVRRVGGQEPGLAWARPPMHIPLALAVAGGLATLLAGGFPIAVALRVVAEAAALVLCLTVGRGTVVAALVAVVLVPFSSHAIQVNPPFPAYLVDVVHVVAAGQWAGAIGVLALLRPPGGWRGAEGREFLRRYGGVAWISFALTAGTGLIQVGEALGALSDLWTTAYGAVLLAKVAGVAGMAAISAVTVRRGLPAARLEAALAAGVVAASAVLVTFPAMPNGA